MTTTPTYLTGLRNLLIRNSPGAHKRGRAIKKFAEKIGLIYFGFVDQNDDEHHVIRGVTAAANHRDSDYTVGSYDGYNVAITSRQRVMHYPDRTIGSEEWIIFEIELHTPEDIPHLFLQAYHTHSTTYAHLLKTTALSPVVLGALESYGQEFTQRYQLLSIPSHAIDAQRLLPPATARTIGAHFWPLSIELHDKRLYIYADHQPATRSLLDMMLTDGIWLAKHIDTYSEEI